MNEKIHLRLEKLESQKKYWLKKLSGPLSEINLIPDFPRVKQYKAAVHKILFGDETGAHLIRISKNDDLSLYVLLLTALKLLIFKITGREDIIISSPPLTRSGTGDGNINFIAFRSLIRAEITFRDFLMQMSRTVSEGCKNRFYSLDNVMEKLGLENHTLFYKIILLVENIHKGKPDTDILARFENDITFFITKKDDRISGEMIYNSCLFKEETMRTLFNRFVNIISQVVDHADMEISQIEVITEDEKRTILSRFNRPPECPGDKTIHALFEDQVEKTPDYAAVIYEEQQLTYRELNERAGRAAGTLRKSGVTGETIVGIVMESSLEMVAAILAVLKAGGAYLPIDPDIPGKRKEYILGNSAAGVLLIQDHLLEHNKDTFSRVSLENIILVDEGIFSAEHRHANAPAAGNGKPGDLLYTIYTSGTTHTPKGVLVEHRGLGNYIRWRLKAYRYREKDVTLQLLSYCFDGYGANFYSALLSGGKLVLIPDSNRLDVAYINNIIRDRGVTNSSLVPGLYRILLDTAGEKELESLRLIILAGEKSDADIIKKSREKNPRIELVNEYGPTETSVTAAANTHLTETDTAVIGKPIDNVNVFICDAFRKLLPVGIPGEIVVGGTGVARGYLNDPERTAETFLSHFLPRTYGVYLTADLGKWRPDGNIEILGRIDAQVKIRGNRIEPGEIEHQLMKHQDIKEALVTAAPDKDGDRYLCAYIVSSREIESPELKEMLSTVLPDYMIPSYFIKIDRMPLTARGKVDREALPKPDAIKTEKDFLPPQGEIENKLTDIWAEVLQIDRESISRDANFFEIGGQSLKAAILAANINKRFNVDIQLPEIFTLSTVARLSAYIKTAVNDQVISISPGEEKEYYRLSSAQMRLYLLNQLETEKKSVNYNMPFCYILEGQPDWDIFEKALQTIIRRQESLRTSFHVLGEEVIQKIHKNVNFKISVDKCPEQEAKEKIKTFIQPFDLSRAPLLRVKLLQVSTHRFFVLFDMHHIISDAISLEILIKEFVDAYKGETLQPLQLQYKDYAVWQAEFRESEEFKKLENYWLTQMENFVLTKLPPDQMSFNDNPASKRVFLSLDQPLCRKIKAFNVKHELTMSTFMMSIFFIVLSKEIDQDVITIGTIFANREHCSVMHLIGIFLNIILVKTVIDDNAPLLDIFSDTKQTVIEGFKNSAYPYELLNYKLRENTKLSDENELFTILFNYFPVEEKSEMLTGTNFKFTPYISENTSLKFDLSLSVADAGKNVNVTLTYNSGLFSEYRIKRIRENMLNVIDALLEDEGIRFDDIVYSEADGGANAGDRDGLEAYYENYEEDDFKFNQVV